MLGSIRSHSTCGPRTRRSLTAATRSIPATGTWGTRLAVRGGGDRPPVTAVHQPDPRRQDPAGLDGWRHSAGGGHRAVVANPLASGPRRPTPRRRATTPRVRESRPRAHAARRAPSGDGDQMGKPAARAVPRWPRGARRRGHAARGSRRDAGRAAGHGGDAGAPTRPMWTLVARAGRARVAS